MFIYYFIYLDFIPITEFEWTLSELQLLTFLIIFFMAEKSAVQ